MALRDLEQVEEIPYDLMASYIDGNWQTFGEYLGFVEKRGIGINVVPIVPLSPLRQVVMGEACWDRAANDDELKELANLFRQCLQAGGWGWSATFSHTLFGYKGRPLPCRLADTREFETLCKVMSEMKTGIVEVSVAGATNELSDQNLEMLKSFARVSGKTVSYLAVMNPPDNPNRYLQDLNKLGDWLDSGRIVPQFFAKPVMTNFNMRVPFAVGITFNVMEQAFKKPEEEIKALYRDPGFRAAFQKQIDEASSIWKGYFERVWVLEGESEEAKALMKSRKSIDQAAKERGVRVADYLLDLVLGDQLKTAFVAAVASYEPEGTKNLIKDGRVLPGLGDAGAHMNAINDSGYATYFLEHWCRQEQVVSLEEAVRMLTSFPAQVFGVKGRGSIAKGNHADLALIDFDNVGAFPAEFAHDLPGGRRRLISRSKGVEATIVNGQILFERGKHSGAFPGKVLRSTDS
jgi:N-acyl-D-aspartate/D-glutamate deacylase